MTVLALRVPRNHQRMKKSGKDEESWARKGCSQNFWKHFGNPMAGPEQQRSKCGLKTRPTEIEYCTGTCGGYDIIKVQGALLEVWNHGAATTRRNISMITGKTMEDLHTDEKMLERERSRLSLQLEQDAKKRLAMVERAERSQRTVSQCVLPDLPLAKQNVAGVLSSRAGLGGKNAWGICGKALAQSGVTTGIDGSRGTFSRSRCISS